MKKFIVLLLGLLLIAMCLTACGEKEETSSSKKKDKVESTVEDEATPSPTEAPTPEPTEAPTPEPTEAPTPTPEPTATPTPEPTEAPDEEPTYKVELIEVGEEKVLAITLYHDYTGADIAEAQAAIDNVPCVLLDGVNEERAKACINAFESIGCVLKVTVNGEEVNTESTENVVEGQLMFSVYLEDAGAEKVKVIQVIRDELGYELQKAKELVEAAPVIIYVAGDLVSASEICDKLAEVGSTATIEVFENPVVGENPKAEANEEVNTEANEENDIAENETTEEVPEVNTEESDDDDYFKMGEFGYFNFPGYQVYIESVGDKGTEVANAYKDFFGDSGTPIKSYEVMTAKDLVVWEIYSESMANDLNKALQDAGATSYVKQCYDLYIIPDEIISGDEDEMAAFIPRDYRMDLMQRNMFMGQMVYGNIAVGDTVYALLEDGTEVELVIRRTYRLSERVQSIDAGDWSALMFESDIPNDKACQTFKIIKRAE